uniref:Uncharacterized protein n=1 Tax=Xenopus tropicalis TaxID=8364 RepID=A0A1B8XT77_XENTR
MFCCHLILGSFKTADNEVLPRTQGHIVPFSSPSSCTKKWDFFLFCLFFWVSVCVPVCVRLEGGRFDLAQSFANQSIIVMYFFRHWTIRAGIYRQANSNIAYLRLSLCMISRSVCISSCQATFE